jgi:hypothetical protein
MIASAIVTYDSRNLRDADRLALAALGLDPFT